MKHFKFVYMCNCILRAVAFICITYAAIHFGKIGILWFYLMPMFMGMDYKSDEKGKSDDQN